MSDALHIPVVGVIARRELLRRDPEVSWPAEIAAIRKVYPSVSTIAWILNVPRTSLIRWMEGACPNYEDGRAVRQLAERCRTT